MGLRATHLQCKQAWNTVHFLPIWCLTFLTLQHLARPREDAHLPYAAFYIPYACNRTITLYVWQCTVSICPVYVYCRGESCPLPFINNKCRYWIQMGLFIGQAEDYLLRRALWVIRNCSPDWSFARINKWATTCRETYSFLFGMLNDCLFVLIILKYVWQFLDYCLFTFFKIRRWGREREKQNNVCEISAYSDIVSN